MRCSDAQKAARLTPAITISVTIPLRESQYTRARVCQHKVGSHPASDHLHEDPVLGEFEQSPCQVALAETANNARDGKIDWNLETCATSDGILSEDPLGRLGNHA